MTVIQHLLELEFKAAMVVARKHIKTENGLLAALPIVQMTGI